MALRMDEADALPRMALVAAFGLACLLVFQGTGIGMAFIQFLVMTLFLPVLALALVVLPLALFGQMAYLRLTAAWILFAVGMAALVTVGLGMTVLPELAGSTTAEATH